MTTNTGCGYLYYDPTRSEKMQHMSWFEQFEQYLTRLEQYITRRHYCTRCHTEIDSNSEVRRAYDFFRLQSWCKSCKDTVDVTTCKVAYWAAVATVMMMLFVPFV